MTRRTEWPLFQKFSSYFSTVSQTSRSRYVGMTKIRSLACIPFVLLLKAGNRLEGCNPHAPLRSLRASPRKPSTCEQGGVEQHSPSSCIPPVAGCNLHDNARRDVSGAGGQGRRAKCKAGKGFRPGPLSQEQLV